MEIKKKINDLINENSVCLFMKGTPDSPHCGFSRTGSNILKHLDVKFTGINVLEDDYWNNNDVVHFNYCAYTFKLFFDGV